MIDKKLFLNSGKKENPYIKFKMIPGEFFEHSYAFTGHNGYNPYATITQFECSKNINITQDEFLNEYNSFCFNFNGVDSSGSWSEFNFSYFHSSPILQQYNLLTMEYENIYLTIPSNNGHNFYTRNIMYHPMYKHCEKWRNYADNNIETDWITLHLLEHDNEYVTINLTLAQTSDFRTLYLYTTDSLDNVATYFTLTDTSKFEFIGSMDVESYHAQCEYFNPISVYIPKNKILLVTAGAVPPYFRNETNCSAIDLVTQEQYYVAGFYNFTSDTASVTLDITWS